MYNKKNICKGDETLLLSRIDGWDRMISGYLAAHRTEGADAFFCTITHLADWYIVVPLVLLLMGVLIRKKKYRPALWTLPMMCTALTLLSILKNLVERPRPEVLHLVAADGYSFPSMHSGLSVLFYGWVACILLTEGFVTGKGARLLKAGAVLLPFLIGCSRMYVNVHYCSDVLAGWFLGGCFLFLTIRLFSRKSRAASPRS